MPTKFHFLKFGLLKSVGMKNVFLMLVAVGICFGAQGRAYRKHVILVGVTEGSTHATYVTNDGHSGAKTQAIANRDPLLIDFGLTNRLSIGLCLGSDIYKSSGSGYPIAPQPSLDRDAISSPGSYPFKTTMSECLLNVDYHYLVRRKWDLSGFGGVGFSGVTGVGNKEGGQSLNYTSNGSIIRCGSKVRFYFCRHFGLVWMLSAFSSANAENNKLSNVGLNLSTKVSGYTSEFGINFRIF